MEKAGFGVDVLADTLGISRPKAYELANSQGFPRIKVGRRIVIPRAAFERWLEAQAEKEASGQA